jgi:DNA-binding transcriptional LysR family regulator
MTLEQLRIFVAVAEREHVTRAAEALRLTQSAVSGAIQALEARHAVTLFARVGRRIELTQDGHAFLADARAVLRAADAAERSLRERQGLERGNISLHASQTTGAYWVPQRLARFRALHPGIELRMSIGNTEQVAAAVANGAAELGFVEGAIDQPDLVADPIDVDRLVIVVARSHPWCRRERVEPAQLRDTAWVLRERGSGTRAVFEQALAGLGIPINGLDIALELPSNEAVVAAVEAGAGASAVSRFVAGPALHMKTLHEVAFAQLERPFVMLRHRERTPSVAALALISMIEAERDGKEAPPPHRSSQSRGTVRVR